MRRYILIPTVLGLLGLGVWLLAAGTATHSTSGRQVFRADGAAWVNWPEQETVRRHNVTLACDKVAQSCDATMTTPDGATLTFTGQLLAVETSPTVGVTDLWDVQLLDDRGANLLSVTDGGATTDYGANLSNSVTTSIRFKYPPPVVGTLRVVVSNTPGTIYLSLYFAR